MRIAIVVNRFPAISETFIFNKVKGLVLRGFDVTVIVHHNEGDSHAFEPDWSVLSGKIRIVRAFGKADRFSFRLYKKVLVNFSECFAFFRNNHRNFESSRLLIQSFLRWLSVNGRYDIVHFEYTGLAIVYLKILYTLKESKVFVSCRGAAEQIKPLTEQGRCHSLRLLFQCVDRVHCVSANMLRICTTLYGLDAMKAFVNRPAINIKVFERSLFSMNRSTLNPVLFCSTGRLHWKKGFEYAILAMKELKDRGYSFRYEIMGDGVEKEKLTFMVRDLELTDYVVFHGSLPSNVVKSRLELCDIYILPSLSEGISNAVLEALAMELPVVATKVGGMEEVIVDNESGLLVDAYDVKQLAEKLVVLMENKDLRVKLSRKGKAAVHAEHSLERQIAIFEDEYHRAADCSEKHL